LFHHAKMSDKHYSPKRDTHDDKYDKYSSSRRYSKRDVSATLFVGGLSRRVVERDVEDLFSKYGRVVKVDLKSGFAFVRYEEPQDADDAIRHLNGIEWIDNCKIRVEPSKGPKKYPKPPMRTDYRVIVDKLAYNVSWQDLKDHMRKAGDVVYADVIKDSQGRSKGYGVVEFRTLDDMDRAIRKLNDTELGGSYIIVKEDVDRKESGSRSRYSSRYSPYRRDSRDRHDRRRRSPSPRRRSPGRNYRSRYV